MSAARWQTVGAVTPTSLSDARLQLHHAMQIVASVGTTFLAPEPDDSHPNAGWSQDLEALVGRPVAGALQAGLRVAAPSMLVVRAGAILEELPLDGNTVDAVYRWLAGALAAGGAVVPAGDLKRPGYDIPDHPVGGGAAFSTGAGAKFVELSKWFANGHQAMSEAARILKTDGEVRCWPHHFDIGRLAVLATDAAGGIAASIGFGLSPGDAAYAEPYWYVSPWPYPDDAESLGALSGGAHWHTDGFTSAVLTATELVSGGPPATQPERLDAYLDAAIDACRNLLEDSVLRPRG